MSEIKPKENCKTCGKLCSVNPSGSLRSHPCVPAPAETEPLPEISLASQECSDSMPAPEKGPWFGALCCGVCAVCQSRFEEGDRVRIVVGPESDYFECEDCGSFDDGMDAHVRASLGIGDTPTADEFMAPTRTQAQAGYTAKPSQVPTPDEFMDPTTLDVVKPALNVSGQPEAKRDWLGRYIIRDPATDDFRWTKGGKRIGFTRTTTFNKAAQDTKALNDWGKRNVLIGAALRPDLVGKAHGLGHKDQDQKKELMKLVSQLEETAGAKVGADIGTHIHELTERIDVGLMTPDDAPAQYRDQLWRYVYALKAAGLEPVPGLIERTVMVSEFGGVAGTFDRVYLHRPSGTYLIGDVKTGKTADYLVEETETQEWIYAHGLNQNGVYHHAVDADGEYDYDNSRWEVPHTLENVNVALEVSETTGVIVWMPVQDEHAGEVHLLDADLVKGRQHAELCHAVKSREKRKPKPWQAPVQAGVAAEKPLNPTSLEVWEHMFAQVQSKDDARVLWIRAQNDGLTRAELDRLADIAWGALDGP